jgi:predicted GTPase
MCRKRTSIVSEEEGVTRDRIYGEADFFSHPLTVVDTGGIDLLRKRIFLKKYFYKRRSPLKRRM